MGIKDKTCCFSGHRIISNNDYDKVYNDTKKAVISLIEKGVIYYDAGGALGFDTLAAQVILDLKKEYPQIKLILVLPCVNQTMKWNQRDIEVYDDIKSKADKVVTLSECYYEGCMQARNRYLVQGSNYCVCFLKNVYSGTGYTVRYAEQQGLTILNVAD